ncbi:MAG: PHP-associated domain-containing protein [Halanaeroarchaeum sp.]
MPTHVDLHVKVLDDRVARRAKARGIDVLVYAPHFRRYPAIEATAERYSDAELLVVPAREVFTGTWRDRKHVLGIDLDEPIPDFVTLEGAMEALDAQAGAVLAPHPEFLTVSLERDDLATYGDVVDAVEVYNPKHLPAHNRRARATWEAFDADAYASSYAHLPGTVGEVWTTFERDIDSRSALVDALTNGAPRRIERRDGPAHDLRRGLEMAHLGYENTWKKIDRLLLSGTEPTHPGHIAYGGAYDDVRVY